MSLAACSGITLVILLLLKDIFMLTASNLLLQKKPSARQLVLILSQVFCLVCWNNCIVSGGYYSVAYQNEGNYVYHPSLFSEFLLGTV